MAQSMIATRYRKAALNRDIGDVGAPHLVGSVDCQLPEKIGINPMRRMGVAGSRRLINGLQPHQAHQTPNPMATDAGAFAPQVPRHLAGAVKWIFEKQLVDAPHQRQVLRALALQHVIERRPADRKKAALTAQTQAGTAAADHRLAFPPAHRLSPRAKKSRSTVN